MNDAEAAMARTERLFRAADDRRQRLRQGPLRLPTPPRPPTPRPRPTSERILAGTWKEDIEIARAAVQLAQSQVETHQDQPRAADRPRPDGWRGPPAQRPARVSSPPSTWKEPMIVLGDIKRLHVRVDIDENDLPYFSTRLRGGRHAQGPAPGPLPPEVRLRRALRHPQAEPDRLQLRARRSRASSRSSTSCPTIGRSTSTSASRWTSTSRPPRPRRPVTSRLAVEKPFFPLKTTA